MGTKRALQGHLLSPTGPCPNRALRGPVDTWRALWEGPVGPHRALWALQRFLRPNKALYRDAQSASKAF